MAACAGQFTMAVIVEIEREFMGFAFAFAIAVLVSIFWGGFVTSTLWGWFLVPLGVKAITYWHAVGLSSLFGSFLGSRGLLNNNSEETPTSVACRDAFLAVVIPAVCLVLGWIAKINL